MMLIDSKHNAPSTDMTCGQRACMHKRTKSRFRWVMLMYGTL
jgi:hypothetical protein